MLGALTFVILLVLISQWVMIANQESHGDKWRKATLLWLDEWATRQQIHEDEYSHLSYDLPMEGEVEAQLRGRILELEQFIDHDAVMLKLKAAEDRVKELEDDKASNE